jgi:shingomyelin synthase
MPFSSLIFTDSSRRLVLLHWTSFIVSTVGVLMILISRGHYTVDILVAYYVTTRLFWMYHTMANNLVLKVSICLLLN